MGNKNKLKVLAVFIIFQSKRKLFTQDKYEEFKL